MKNEISLLLSQDRIQFYNVTVHVDDIVLIAKTIEDIHNQLKVLQHK
jgi:hypothetical protein